MADKMESGAASEAPAAGAPRRERSEPVVVREFAPVGKYRVRVVKSSPGPRATAVMDIREYAKGENFEGFTRRGIRLATLEEARLLVQALRSVEDEHLIK